MPQLLSGAAGCRRRRQCSALGALPSSPSSARWNSAERGRSRREKNIVKKTSEIGRVSGASIAQYKLQTNSSCPTITSKMDDDSPTTPATHTFAASQNWAEVRGGLTRCNLWHSFHFTLRERCFAASNQQHDLSFRNSLLYPFSQACPRGQFACRS